MTHIASDGSNQAPLVATGTPVPGTDAQTYKASDGTLQEALPVQGAGGDGGPVDWTDVQNKPATYPPEIGTTGTTAKAGDYEPEWGDIQSKPAVMAAGSSASAARAAISAIGTDQMGVPNGVAPLDSSGLIPLEYLNVSGLAFKGPWDPATNTPELLNGTGSVGDFYKSTGSGTYDFGSGSHSFVEGDWVIFAGGVWQRIGVHETVASVNGKTGAIVLNASDVGALPDNYTAPVTSVAGKTGAVTLNASDVGARPSSYVPAWSEVTDKPNFATLYSPKPRGNMSHPIPAVYAGLSANQTLPTGVTTNIVFGTSSFDQFSMLTEDGFVVPSWASHARVTLALAFEANGTGARYVSVTRNSTTLNPVRVVAVSGATTIAILTTPIREMPSGSILNAAGWQNSGGDLNVTTASWIQIELFETI
jgi:hypothetical protein